MKATLSELKILIRNVLRESRVGDAMIELEEELENVARKTPTSMRL